VPWYQYDNASVTTASTSPPPAPATLSLTTRGSEGGSAKTAFLSRDPVWCTGSLLDDELAAMPGVQVVVGLLDTGGNWVTGLADGTTSSGPFAAGLYGTYFVASDIPESYWAGARLIATCTVEGVEVWSKATTITIKEGGGDGDGGEFPWWWLAVGGGVAAIAAITLLAAKREPEVVYY